MMLWGLLCGLGIHQFKIGITLWPFVTYDECKHCPKGRIEYHGQ